MDVIQLLEKEGTWIRSDFKTRDHLLHGSEDAQIHTVGVCWVATTQAIQEAARHKADMIITHENPFYQCSTQMHTAAYEAAKSKRRLLDQYGISVYPVSYTHLDVYKRQYVYYEVTEGYCGNDFGKIRVFLSDERDIFHVPYDP